MCMPREAQSMPPSQRHVMDMHCIGDVVVAGGLLPLAPPAPLGLLFFILGGGVRWPCRGLQISLHPMGKLTSGRGAWECRLRAKSRCSRRRTRAAIPAPFAGHCPQQMGREGAHLAFRIDGDGPRTHCCVRRPPADLLHIVMAHLLPHGRRVGMATLATQTQAVRPILASLHTLPFPGEGGAAGGCRGTATDMDHPPAPLRPQPKGPSGLKCAPVS